MGLGEGKEGNVEKLRKTTDLKKGTHDRKARKREQV